MFSTLKPTDIVAPNRESVQTVNQDDSQAPSEDVRLTPYPSKADMRGNSGISMAGVDFSVTEPTTEGASEQRTLGNLTNLEAAVSWFQEALNSKLTDAGKRIGRGADPLDLCKTESVDLMEHAVAIAKVLRIEMPGLVAALIRPDLAKNARQFAAIVADGLEDFGRQVAGMAPDGAVEVYSDDCVNAITALRGDRPNLSVIWAKNPLFNMHPSEDELLNTKIEQYTARQKEMVG